MIRVLHVTPSFHPSVGGIENAVENLARHSRANGVEADVAHVAPGLSPSQECHADLMVHRIPLRGHLFAGLAPRIGRIAHQYDLLHVHDPQLLSLTGSVALFGAGCPAVLSTHGGSRHTTSFALPKRLHAALVMRRALAQYRLVLATSTSDHAYFHRYGKQVVLAENGVDVSRFLRLGAVSRDRSPLSWITWGRLARHKRVDQVVDLSLRARALGHDVTLTICGSDFDGAGEALRARLAAPGHEHVRLVDGVDDATLARLASQAGVFVSASEYEGFGLSVVEAMAAGLVVVCRDIDPLRDFVCEKTGLRLSYAGGTDEHNMLDRFLAQLTQEREGFAAAARQRAAHFDWTCRIGRFVTLYEEALSRAETGVRRRLCDRAAVPDRSDISRRSSQRIQRTAKPRKPARSF